jgi:hypothetical protein
MDAVGPYHAGLDAPQLHVEARDAAFHNMRDNLDRLPATVLARYGRSLGVFRPAQTVEIVANWLGTATWPVWAWIASFWVLLRSRPTAACACASPGASSGRS